MPDLPITSVLAALAAIGLVALSLPVSLRRMKVGAAIGDGGDDELRRRIRAQGNYIEYAPLGLVVLALAELTGAGAAAVLAAAACLAVGRLSHAVGMLADRLPLRALGMVLTYTALLVCAAALLLRAL